MIKDLFEENKISYQNTDVPQQLADLKLDGRILEYPSGVSSAGTSSGCSFHIASAELATSLFTGGTSVAAGAASYVATVSEYGVASTRLFSVETILEEVFDEYNKPCIENGYLIIGEGPNGDLLCVDIKKGTVGYAYHDELWEGSFEDFSSIYIDMPILLEKFIDMMLKDEFNYPFDGYEAEKYLG